MQLISDNTTRKFRKKPQETQDLINEALFILDRVGVPMDNLVPRRLEKMAMVFLALADVKSSKDWPRLKDANDNQPLKTKDVIRYINQYFNEDISNKSYDDLYRQDILPLITSDVIIQTAPYSPYNNPMRGYAINPGCSDIIRSINFEYLLDPNNPLHHTISLPKISSITKETSKISIRLSSGMTIDINPSKHSILQKAIVEEFLPRFIHNSKVLYIGGDSDHFTLIEKGELKYLAISGEYYGFLPDIVVYSQIRSSIYFIEAAHTSRPISPMRLLELKTITANCTTDIIYVTAFLNRYTFRKFTSDIAWETKVWIATEPDRLLHFNGKKFLISKC